VDLAIRITTSILTILQLGIYSTTMYSCFVNFSSHLREILYEIAMALHTVIEVYMHFFAVRSIILTKTHINNKHKLSTVFVILGMLFIGLLSVLVSQYINPQIGYYIVAWQIHISCILEFLVLSKVKITTSGLPYNLNNV
jgi:hypothetical protein